MKHFVIVLEPDLHTRVKTIAGSRRLSMKAAIREAAVDWINKGDKPCKAKRCRKASATSR